MRFGWLAAAAAMVCASQAGAVNWVRYQFAGIGTVTRTVNNFDGTFSTFGPNPQDITVTFTIDTDQYPFFDSAVTGPAISPARTTATGSATNIIASGSLNTNSRFFQSFQVNAAFAGIAADGGFATSVPDGLATGSISSVASSGIQLPENTSYQASIRTVQISSATGFEGFALTAVPEPASWAMMIGGFGVVGGALRRRRGQRAYITAA